MQLKLVIAVIISIRLILLVFYWLLFAFLAKLYITVRLQHYGKASSVFADIVLNMTVF